MLTIWERDNNGQSCKYTYWWQCSGKYDCRAESFPATSCPVWWREEGGRRVSAVSQCEVRAEIVLIWTVQSPVLGSDQLSIPWLSGVMSWRLESVMCGQAAVQQWGVTAEVRLDWSSASVWPAVSPGLQSGGDNAADWTQWTRGTQEQSNGGKLK